MYIHFTRQREGGGGGNGKQNSLKGATINVEIVMQCMVSSNSKQFSTVTVAVLANITS